MKKIVRWSLLMAFTLGVMFFNPLQVEATEVLCDVEKAEQGTDGTYQIDFTLQTDYAFAGGEFAVECPEGIKISNVRYDIMTSAVTPTVARGATWFGFFSGSNEYEKPVTVSMTLTCDEMVRDDVIKIIQAKIYTADNEKYGTEIVDTEKEVQLAGLEGRVMKDIDEEATAASKAPSLTEDGKRNMVICVVIGILVIAGVFTYICYKKNKVKKEEKNEKRND